MRKRDWTSEGQRRLVEASRKSRDGSSRNPRLRADIYRMKRVVTARPPTSTVAIS